MEAITSGVIWLTRGAMQGMKSVHEVRREGGREIQRRGGRERQREGRREGWWEEKEGRKG